MMNTIEKLLEIKSKDAGCEAFLSQWMLARDYVPKVQSVITQTFPHYSLHDRTHSETILNCIVRVLGQEAIEKLGPVDLWLLLAAAYYHDLGMAVYGEEVVSSFQNEEFLYFVRECQEDETNPLHPFAILFEVKDNCLHFKDVSLDGKSYDAPRFLLAEYIRRKHSKRSSDSLYGDLSVHLAGDPIPDRIIRLLANICESHTKDFKKVMQLPFCETGMGLDDCHPRFVACMLRLGDLLDIDNNRFSSVLLRTLPVIPRDSLLHVGKHLSIEHLRIDSARIEVSAKTENYEVADVTNSWLEMIGEEFSRQRESWDDIAPSGFPGHLPTVGTMKVDLVGYDTIDGKKRPGFEVDTSKAIEMLQGAGLYTSPAQCIRELLQNAVDATYLAIYTEKGSLSLEDFQEACRQKTIKVAIDKGEETGDKVAWRVSIEDDGIGMSKTDMSFLTRMGSKNPERKRMIESMPDYMRPSGTFGIGFQSVFLMTDKVVLTTRKRDSSEQVTAELYDPAGTRKGAVLLQTVPASMHPGTRLQFEYLSDRNLNHWQVSSGEVYASFEVYSFDFITDKTMNLDTARVLDEITSFARASMIHLDLTMEGRHIELPTLEGELFDYYSQEQGIQVGLLSDDHFIDLFYRNQPVKKAGIRIPFLSVKANVLGGNAKDLLSLNRNELQYSAKEPIRQKVCVALIEALEKTPGIVTDSVRPSASMFVHDFAPKKLHLFPSLRDGWRDYLYQYVNDSKRLDFGHRFGEIVDKTAGKTVVWSRSGRDYGLDEKDDAIILRVPDAEAFDFLLRQLWQTHPYPCTGTSPYWEGNGFSLHCREIDPIQDYGKWMKRYSQRDIYARSMMPCNAEFKALRIDPEVRFNFSFDSTFPVGNYPKMICPYVRRMEMGVWYPVVSKVEWDDSDGDLYQQVYDHRADKAVTLDDIKKAYEAFREKLDPIVEGVNKKQKENDKK